MSLLRYLASAAVVLGLLAACSGGGSPPTQVSNAGPSATPVPTATPTAASAPTPSSSPTAPVTVEVSGSTNTKPFQIVLKTDDSTIVTKDYGSMDSTTQVTTVPPADADQFFMDLIADTPISEIQPAQCPKSTSYGTTTSLTYDGYTSGDVSCATMAVDAKGQVLFADEQKIEADIRATLGTIDN